MKKIIIISILTITLSFCGCGESAEQTSSSAPNTLAITDDSSVAETSAEQTSSVSTVVVPDVVGMDKDEAVKKLEDLGLKVELKFWRGYSTTEGLVPHNVVYEQSAAGGVIMALGETIKISYCIHENGYMYDINNDGTITVNTILFKVYDEKTGAYIMPKTYDGYVISAITESAAHQLASIYGFGDSDHTLIKLPKGVKINMQEEFKYEEY